jgi:hypothetical protein
MKKEGLSTMAWRTLFEIVGAQRKEFLEIHTNRAPKDERLKGLGASSA